MTYDEAWSHLNRGELKSALEIVDSRLALLSPSEGYWYWKLVALKAEILMQERHTKDALALLQPALPSDLAGTDVDLRRKMTLGIANAYSLNFAESERLLADAERLAKAGHPELLGDVVLREGTLALTKSEYEVASTHYRAALQLAMSTKNPFLEAACLGSLGLVAARQEHYDESMEWNRKALERSLAINAGSSVARILGNLGWSYLEIGDYERALDLLEQARTAAERAGTVRLQIDVLENIGIAYYQQGQYELSKRSAQQALNLASSISDKTAMAECFRNLAQLGLATGELEFARQNQEKVSEFVRQYPNPSLELFSFLVLGRLQQSRHEYKESEVSFRRVADDAAATVAQKWEAQSQLAQTYNLENRPADAERQYREALATIEKARSSFGAEELRLVFLSRPISVYGAYIDFLLSRSRVEEALKIAEQSRALTLEEGLETRSKGSPGVPPKIAPQSISRQLHATLLCYWLGEQHSYLWVVTPTATKSFNLPPQGEVQEAVKAYQQSIVEMHDVLKESNPEGKRLYAMLVEPAQKLLPKGSRVLLLPSESLYGLNFETLIVPTPTPHYWIEDVTLSTGSSLRLLYFAARQTTQKKKSLLLVGNPEPPNRDYPLLAQAPDEIKKVGDHFHGSQLVVLDGRQATTSAYLHSNPQRFSYLHFVAHGIASHTRPLESAVILSREGDSYKLYARDILAHPLKAELVTISACNGAGTRTYAGEGLVGLSWAFLRAGSRNVIASLWEVSDASSTPRLMDALYEGLDHGQDPAAALRNAKLSILKSNTQTVFSKPFYWAPFQIYSGS